MNDFDTLIEMMFADGTLDQSVRQEIEGMNDLQKRLHLIKILDKGLNLFTKIESIINLPKMDYIKGIITFLKDYVLLADVEKKKFGEVMTPLTLVKEMLATLPEEVWSNPELKWLDPANGTGPYPILVIYKLMNGLKDWESDEEKRYKHIIENMIYVCELQPKNMFLYMFAIDPLNNYSLKVYNGSFLESQYDVYMKKSWHVERFDVTIGNPPYNTDANGDFQTTDLYDKFVINSMKISEYILMITPARWMNKNDKLDFRKDIVKFGIKKLIFDKNINFFENTNISGGITYFLLKNGFTGYTIFNNNEVNLKKQLDDVGFIMDGNTQILNSILLKLSKHEKLDNFNSQSYFGLKTNHQQTQNEGLKVYFSDRNGRRLKLEHDGNSYYTFINSDIITDVKNKKSKYKVITPSAYGYKTKDGDFYHRLGKTFISQPNEVCTESYVFFDFNSELECKNFIKYLNSNLVKYLISIKKIKQHVTSKIFELVPKISFETEISDQYLYKLFKLSDSEVEFLENQKL